MERRGTLYGVGVGPGDPELMSLKAARILKAAPVIAYFAKKGLVGNARRIVDGHLNPEAELVRLDYPITTELAETDPEYIAALVGLYDESAAILAQHLDRGADVAVLCAGDPFFYGSYAHLHERLAEQIHLRGHSRHHRHERLLDACRDAHDLRRRDARGPSRHHGAKML